MIAENRGPQGAERRRDPRREVTVPARLTLVGLTVDGRLANVSARGVCFLTTNPHLRVAESNFVRIRFTLPPGAGDGGDAPGGEVPGGAAPAQAALAVERYVRITRIEQVEVDGAAGRRLGLAWDEPIVLAALQ